MTKKTNEAAKEEETRTADLTDAIYGAIQEDDAIMPILLKALRDERNLQREEDAKVCDKLEDHCIAYDNPNAADYCSDCAKQIRAMREPTQETGTK